ncbi:MAG TPA: redoxin domain-containing protein [Acidimicrobiia bacterium]|nr:redoxin domain-containing protein [Acidimicrobiia bacterium]
MRNPSRWIAIGIAAVVALFGVALATQVGSDPSYAGGAILQRRAPDFDLPLLDVDGARVNLTSLRGQSVIVNFWNSWCLPCRAEAPALLEFWDRHAGDGDVAMVGIVRDESPSAARKGAREDGFDWTLAIDPDGQAAIAYGTTGQPETFAISPAGVVTGKQLSEVSVDDLEALLARARAG